MRIRTSRTGRSTAAFTLVELLVVLTILALVAAVMAPYMPRLIPGAAVRTAALEVAAGLRHARSRAIHEDGDVIFQVNVRDGTYIMTGESRPHRLTHGPFDLLIHTAVQEKADDITAGIRFFPDGSSTGGRVRVAKGSRSYDVTVEWLTGRVAISD